MEGGGMSREGRPRWGLMQTFIIGRQDNPMMKRLRIVQTPLFGVYLHFIYREDRDPVPHDHPWNFFRMVLRGGYTEEYYGRIIGATRTLQPLRPGYFPTDSYHRITSVQPGTVSLVVVGRKTRIWGFWTPTKIAGIDAWVWVDYRDALDLRPTEGVSA